MNDNPCFTIILFILPDKRMVLQRRTKDAPYAPGKLGIFGGYVEEGETPDECLLREIKEEVSLAVEDLDIKSVTDFILPKNQDFDRDRHFYLYYTHIPTIDFEVYEGDGAEAFTIAELQLRQDLTGSALYTLQNVLTEDLIKTIL